MKKLLQAQKSDFLMKVKDNYQHTTGFFLRAGCRPSAVTLLSTLGICVSMFSLFS